MIGKNIEDLSKTRHILTVVLRLLWEMVADMLNENHRLKTKFKIV